MNAVYVRVSSEEQAKSGYSLGDQLQVCRNRLISMGLTAIKEYIDDGYSGEYLDRPALEELRNDLRAKLIQNICIYDPDRLSRNLTNQLLIADEIEKSGINLYFVTGDYDASPEGRLFFSIRGAISAFEKAKIRERTQRGRKAKANSGKIVHNARPYGYNFDKETSMYIINDDEAQVVRKIYAMCIEQGLGARTITLELARTGVKGRKDGKPLSINCVERVLTRDMYYGQHYLFRQSVSKTGQNTREITDNPREDWIPITVPAIVDYETYQRAQKQRQKNKRFAKRNTTHEYLLQGILYCSLCQRSMTAYGRPGQRKKTAPKMYYYYSCITKESGNYMHLEPCQCRRIPSNEFDESVWDIFVNSAQGSDSLDRYIKQDVAKDYSKEIDKSTRAELDLLKKRSEITSWFREDLIDADMAKKELQVINRELVSIASTITTLRHAQDKLAFTGPAVLPEEILAAKTFADKQDIIRRSDIKIYAVRRDDSV
ncbi:recombinase family protein, partial [Sporomusa sp.]|uniref:recombinase family protein n=1 Tax=Sporomusa sp. TaxID=2078658 RepID=UPI002C1F92EE